MEELYNGPDSLFGACQRRRFVTPPQLRRSGMEMPQSSATWDAARSSNSKLQLLANREKGFSCIMVLVLAALWSLASLWCSKVAVDV